MDLKSFTTGPCESVAELIEFEESLFDFVENRPPRRWAFRGQPRDFGTLMPSFQRQFSRKSSPTAEIIERRLVDAFRIHYAKLNDRSADMPRPEHIGPGFDMRCLSVMQHYEIPTRLLDWSENFWTAVYFACASDSGTTGELWYYDRRIFDAQRAKDSSLLSLLDTSSNPPHEPPLLFRRGEALIVELDPKISPRMKQQNAHHTVCVHVFSDHAPLLFDLMQKSSMEPEKVPLLGRVLISDACKSRTLQFLAEEKNITASTIFPDVVGLGRFLRWQFESLRTMLL